MRNYRDSNITNTIQRKDRCVHPINIASLDQRSVCDCFFSSCTFNMAEKKIAFHNGSLTGLRTRAKAGKRIRIHEIRSTNSMNKPETYKLL